MQTRAMKWWGCAPVAILAVLASRAHGQTTLIDDSDGEFEWTVAPSPGAELDISQIRTEGGEAVRLAYDFAGGGSYVSARLYFDEPIELPERFRLNYRLRSDDDPQGIDFKLIHSTPEGERVWWETRPRVEFTGAWEQRSLRRRHVAFAWGPGDRNEGPSQLTALEIAITAASGGRGEILIDDFELEALPPIPDPMPTPVLQADAATDETYREGKAIGEDGRVGITLEARNRASLVVDLGFDREIGAIGLGWAEQHTPGAYSIDVSTDGENWTERVAVEDAMPGSTTVHMPDTDARWLRIRTEPRADNAPIELASIDFISANDTASRNAFAARVAKASDRGVLPEYLLDRQIFWTVVGLPSHPHEALMNEHGMIEVARGGFSLDPMIIHEGELLTWADGQHAQDLEEGSLPIPSVTRTHDDLEITSRAIAIEHEGKAWVLMDYRVKNTASERIDPLFVVAIRPFQVLPPWQNLNLTGGVSPITDIKLDDQTAVVNERLGISSLTRPTRFGATSFGAGEIGQRLARNSFPAQQSAADPGGLASAAFQYQCHIPPGESAEISVTFPLTGGASRANTQQAEFGALPRVRDDLIGEQIQRWHETLGPVRVTGPEPIAQWMETARAQLAYMLIHADPPRLHPGSRTYERSWIRDGSITAITIALFGHEDAAINFLDWYSPYVRSSGEVPAVVDDRGADPLLEHDSTGQYLHLVWSLYALTEDRSILERHFDRVERGVDYLLALRDERLGEPYTGTAFEGVLPESASHEGYLSKPMHSYWDGFFALRGLRDAARTAEALGRDELAAEWSSSAERFARDLFRSIERAMARHGIDYIPGCVELGDFDATSTAIALVLGLELSDSIRPEFEQTFDKYWQHFNARAADTIQWHDYTPYEVRIIDAMVRLGHPDRARTMLDWFFSERQPAGWRQWGEIAYRDARHPAFVGDMPHTWVGAGYVRAARSMIAYEHGGQNALVLARGVDPAWITDDEPLVVEALPTLFGDLSYSMERRGGAVELTVRDGLRIPSEGVVYHVPEGWRASMDGDSSDPSAQFAAGVQIGLQSLPARIVLVPIAD